MSRLIVLSVSCLALAVFCFHRAVADDEKQPEVKPRVKKVVAQPRVAFFGGGNSNYLLRLPQVQQELKLDEDQKTKIQEAAQEYSKQRRDLFAGLQSVQGDERQKKIAEFRKKAQELTAQADKKVRGLLKPEQAERLGQILLQTRGIRALSDAQTAGKLKITDGQKQKIADIQADAQQQSRQLFQDIRNGKLERAKFAEKRREITRQTEKKTLEVLTPEQQAQFEKLKGKKFDLPRPALQAVPAVPLKLKIQPRKIQKKAVPIG